MVTKQAFKLNPAGQLIVQQDQFGNQSFRMCATDREYVEQNIRLRVSTTLGEDILHPEVGLPFADIVRVSTNPYLEDRIRDCVGLDEDVARVDEVDSVAPSRERNAQATVISTSVTGVTLSNSVVVS